MPTIVHFEIPSDDIEGANKFYNDLFGWKIEKWAGGDDRQLTSAVYSRTTLIQIGKNEAITH
jgi:predicted enzyme related to lactoylglutathione lyase